MGFLTPDTPAPPPPPPKETVEEREKAASLQSQEDKQRRAAQEGMSSTLHELDFLGVPQEEQDEVDDLEKGILE